MLEFDEKKRANYQQILQEFYPQAVGIEDIKPKFKSAEIKDYVCFFHPD